MNFVCASGGNEIGDVVCLDPAAGEDGNERMGLLDKSMQYGNSLCGGGSAPGGKNSVGASLDEYVKGFG